MSWFAEIGTRPAHLQGQGLEVWDNVSNNTREIWCGGTLLGAIPNQHFVINQDVSKSVTIDWDNLPKEIE